MSAGQLLRPLRGAARCAALCLAASVVPGAVPAQAPVAFAQAVQASTSPYLAPAPGIFDASDSVAWDGRRTLQGIWVAHPLATSARRVRIVNTATGTAVDGALFKRDPALPGQPVLISSEAATVLGMTPGEAAELRIVALRPVQQAETAPQAQPDAATPDDMRQPAGGAARTDAPAAAPAADQASGNAGPRTGAADPLAPWARAAAGQPAASETGALADRQGARSVPAPPTKPRPSARAEVPGSPAPAGETPSVTAAAPTGQAPAGQPAPSPVVTEQVPGAVAISPPHSAAAPETGRPPAAEAAPAASTPAIGQQPATEVTPLTVAEPEPAAGGAPPRQAPEPVAAEAPRRQAPEGAFAALALTEPPVGAQADAPLAAPPAQEPRAEDPPPPALSSWSDLARSAPAAPAPVSRAAPVPEAGTASSPAAEPAPPQERTASLSPLSRPYVQAGLFGVSDNATRLIERLRAADLPALGKPARLNGRPLTRVLAGPFASEAERTGALRTIREMGLRDAMPVAK